MPVFGLAQVGRVVTFFDAQHLDVKPGEQCEDFIVRVMRAIGARCPRVSIAQELACKSATRSNRSDHARPQPG
jgi:hypothetical protein